jgi:hypothetical protein
MKIRLETTNIFYTLIILLTMSATEFTKNEPVWTGVIIVAMALVMPIYRIEKKE